MFFLLTPPPSPFLSLARSHRVNMKGSGGGGGGGCDGEGRHVLSGKSSTKFTE